MSVSTGQPRGRLSRADVPFRRAGCRWLALAAAVAGAISPAAALAGDPGLVQLAGRAGCVSDTGGKGRCANGRGLSDAGSIAVSPDGRNVYAASSLSGSVTVFRRDRDTGRTSQLPGGRGCLAGSSPYRPRRDCARLAGVALAPNLAVSPDGRNVYVSSWSFTDPSARSVIALARDRRSGALTPVAGGCVNENAANGCSAAGPLFGGKLAVSPDGEHVYAQGARALAGPRPGVVILRRDPATGALTQPPAPAGCVSDDPAAGCAPGRALTAIQDLATSPDGRGLYVAGSPVEHPGGSTSSPAAAGTLAALARDPTSGALSQPAGAASCHRAPVEGITYPPASQCLPAGELLATPQSPSALTETTSMRPPARGARTSTTGC